MRDLQLGTLRMSASKASHRLTCVQFAVGDGVIALCSFAGPQTAVKALSAAFNQNCKLHIFPGGFEWGNGNYEGPVRNGEAYEPASGQGQYLTTMHRLGFNYVHATAIRKDLRLIPNLSDESLWRILSGTRFTTPLLRSWIPELRRMLEKEELLKRLLAFNCCPAHLLADSESLDDVVSRGIKSGRLEFPKERQCSS